jgi:uncharacterized membrane protein YebE (DUF533 family)
MFDPKQLLNQFLGSSTGASVRDIASRAQQGLDQAGGTKSFAGGAALGGILGMMLGGGRRSRGFGGGLLSHGGAAALGALAMRAYQNYQQQQPAAAAKPMTSMEVSQVAPQSLPHQQAAADGGPLELVLLRAMVGAAKSDGHVDADEQQHLFAEVERMSLDAEAKAFIFDLLAKPVELSDIASKVNNEAQAGEVYLAARLAINPDQPAERAYLDALASRMKLPPPFREHLDKQASGFN